MNVQPRNDYVIIEVVNRGETPSGISVSAYSLEGKDYFVHAKGPAVEHLEVGDKVLAIGTLGEDYAYLPNSSTLFMVKQANIPLVFIGMNRLQGGGK